MMEIQQFKNTDGTNTRAILTGKHPRNKKITASSRYFTLLTFLTNVTAVLSKTCFQRHLQNKNEGV
jgi:hypothetical protein